MEPPNQNQENCFQTILDNLLSTLLYRENAEQGPEYNYMIDDHVRHYLRQISYFIHRNSNIVSGNQWQNVLYMVSHETVISARNLIKQTNPLILAFIRRDKQKVISLLNLGHNVQFDFDTKFVCSPLFYAIKMADVQILRLLLSKGICFKEINHRGETPYGLALKTGNKRIMKLILQVYIAQKFHPANYRGYTPLHVACALGDLKIVKRFFRFTYFLNYRINTDGLEYSGFTPMHFAVHQNHVQLLRYLIFRGADFTIEDGNGESPFFMAHKQKNELITEVLATALLKRYSNTIYREKGFLLYCEEFFDILYDEKRIDHDDTWLSCSPLHFSVIRRDLKTIKYLLNKKANVNAIDCYGSTPLHFACESIVAYDYKNYVHDVTIPNVLQSNIHFVEDQEKQFYIVKLLSRYNADMNIVNKDGVTPIYYVIKRYVLETKNFSIKAKMRLPHLFSRTKQLLHLLLKQGANVKTPKTSCGKTILHILSTVDIVTKVEKQILEMILKAGAEVNLRDNKHESPLNIAAGCVCINTLKVLLKYSKVCSIDCLFALSLPTTFLKDDDYITILDILVEKGLDINRLNLKKQNALHATVNVPYFGEKIEKYEGDKRVSALLKYGCEIDIQDEYGRTPLHYAAANRHIPATIELLNWGANINIEDIYGNTFISYAYENPKEPEDQYTINMTNFLIIVRNHINKLLNLNFPVSSKNTFNLFELEIFCNNILDIKIPSINKFVSLCKEEVEKMKQTRLNNFTCLYDILFKNTDEMVVHVVNEKFNDILFSGNFEERFQLYGSMLKVQHKKGMIRKELLNPAKKTLIYLFKESLSNVNYIVDVNQESFNLCQKSLPDLSQQSLPDLCIEKVFSYLRIVDLQRLIKSCNPKKRKIHTETNENDKNLGHSLKRRKLN